MDKAQAIQQFWSGFGLTAYDENTVPEDAEMPYITYSAATGAIDDVVPMTGSLWYRSVSWRDISIKAEEIARAVGEKGFLVKSVDNGYLWVNLGSPFSQRMSDQSDDMIRRIYIVLSAEFLTPY